MSYPSEIPRVRAIDEVFEDSHRINETMPDARLQVVQ